MSIHDDVLSLIKTIADRTGDPNAWKTGLNSDEIISVLSPVASNEQLARILDKLRSRQTTVSPSSRSDDGQTSTASDGVAAEAVSSAERDLAQQNSATSQLDLQVVSAILNAHTTAVTGRERLDSLQRDVETAVRSRSDLDTPAGARDFQRFLIGKLREIQTLVATTGLEATSQSLLLAATASLYEASKKPPDISGELLASDPGADPTAVRRDPVSANPSNEIGYLTSDLPAPAVTRTALEAPSVPANSVPAPLGSPAGPGIGAPEIPFGGSAGWGSAGGIPESALFDNDQDDIPAGHRGRHRNDALSALVDDSDSSDKRHSDTAQEDPDPRPEQLLPDEVLVTLPDGDTISVASSPLAEVISAAIGGTPIEEAFREQGVIISPPGTPVLASIDAASVTAGDVGMFTDHHVLAVGHDKVLVERQIQHIGDIGGPSFLGWIHPPELVDDRPQATASAQTHPTGISTGWVRSD